MSLTPDSAPEPSEPTASRKPLTGAERMEIRGFFANALSVGLSPEMIEQRNGQLIERLGASLPQIKAVQSQMKIRADGLLKELGLHGTTPREAVIAALEDWMIGVELNDGSALPAALKVLNSRSTRELSSEEAKMLMTRYAALIEEELTAPPRARTDTASVNKAETKEPTTGTQAQIGTPTDLSGASFTSERRVTARGSEAPTSPPPETPSTPEATDAGSEYTDYDFPAKIAWRREIIDSINRLFSDVPRAVRADMNVLFLPSIDKGRMEQQVTLLESIGFRRKNMVGYEGTSDPELKSLFLENALKVGIVPVCGKLETALKHDTRRYGVVWLDFPGPISNTYRSIARNILLADRACVSFNLMEGRESEAVQQSLDATRLFNAKGGLMHMLEHQDRFLLGDHSMDWETLRGEVDHTATGRPSASALREELGESTLLQLLGEDRPENLKNLGEKRALLPDPSRLPALGLKVISRIAHRHLVEGLKTIFQGWADEYVNQLRQAAQAPRAFVKPHQLHNFETRLRSAKLAPSYEECVILTEMYCIHPALVTAMERCSYQSAARSGRYFYSVTARVDTPRSKYDELRRTGQAFRDFAVDWAVRNNDPVRNPLPIQFYITDEYRRAPRISGAHPKGSDLICLDFQEPEGPSRSVFTLPYRHLRTDLSRMLEINRNYRYIRVGEDEIPPQKMIRG